MRTVALLSTLLAAGLAFADGGPRWRTGRTPYPARAGADVVRRAINNLARSPSYRHVSNHDRRHYEKAREDLRRFQVNWSRGKFDTGRLDSAIDNLKHLAKSNRVHPRERQMFARDIEDLRWFRANRGYANARWRY